jgi:hypothetical protein
MYDELNPAFPGETNQQALDRENRFSTAQPLRVASEYEAAFQRGKLDLLIRRETPDSEYRPGELHGLLLELPWADVFTTNYDTLLERTEVPGRNYQVVSTASELTTAFAPRIVKLHGSFHAQTPLIIAEEDYRRYPKDFAPFVNSVQQSLLENAFVLLGFSGEDPNFLEWTGWIRDELGPNHAPIYLVGPLALGTAQRSLLERRGVTPIDLSPVFAGFQGVGNIHATSVEWFLRSLYAAKPARPESWPGLERNTKVGSKALPPIARTGPVDPEKVEQQESFANPLRPETIPRLLCRWRFERERYPGWVIAPEDKRSTLWEKTKYWLDPILTACTDLPAEDRLLRYSEINWRLETAMVPLFAEWVKAFENAVRDAFPTVSDMSKMRSASPDLANAWFQIGFALLREARETYNTRRWEDLKKNIDSVIPRHPEFSDRNQYEAALWAIWNVEREKARMIMSAWQPSSRSPLATMWKAGLLAELDELTEARTLLRAALIEIRRGLRTQGQNCEVLSQEGWCMFLLFQVEGALDFSRWFAVRDEFWERWQELKALDCSPWPHKEHLENLLKASPPKPAVSQELVPGFEVGHTRITHHMGADQVGRFLPGFAFIRLFEQVGMPMRLKRVSLYGDGLKNACRWIAPFIGFWSPALLVRVGDVKDLTEGGFLTRTEVAAMKPQLATQLYNWAFGILEREITNLNGHLTDSSAEESLIEVLPQVLSRLAFRVDETLLAQTFPFVLRFHTSAGAKSHIRLHDACTPWFVRLFDAAGRDLLLEWLPELLRAPLCGGSIHSLLPSTHTSPDPMRDFPSTRLRQLCQKESASPANVEQAINWLLARTESETGEARHRAIDRLAHVYQAKLLTPIQVGSFARLLWDKTEAGGIPQRPAYAASSMLHLPVPPDADVVLALKRYILNLRPQQATGQDATGKSVRVVNPHTEPFIQEVALASKPVVQLPWEFVGKVDWEDSESKQLYLRAHEWWCNEKQFINALKKSENQKSFGYNGLEDTIELLVEFLSRAVLPKMEWAQPSEWLKAKTWLQEIRETGVFPTVAAVHLLIKAPEEKSSVEATILKDIESDTEAPVAAAAEAIRVWVHLHRQGFVPPIHGLAITKLIHRVVFRRPEGVSACLHYLSRLIEETPDVFTDPDADLIAESLMTWNLVTQIPTPKSVIGEFPDWTRPLLRMRLTALAGCLSRRHTRLHSGTEVPAILGCWKDVAASDPLPEVRRAFGE